jgi:hypothetical protein
MKKSDVCGEKIHWREYAGDKKRYISEMAEQ